MGKGSEKGRAYREQSPVKHTASKWGSWDLHSEPTDLAAGGAGRAKLKEPQMF